MPRRKSLRKTSNTAHNQLNSVDSNTHAINNENLDSALTFEHNEEKKEKIILKLNLKNINTTNDYSNKSPANTTRSSPRKRRVSVSEVHSLENSQATNDPNYRKYLKNEFKTEFELDEDDAKDSIAAASAMMELSNSAY